MVSCGAWPKLSTAAPVDASDAVSVYTGETAVIPVGTVAPGFAATVTFVVAETVAGVKLTVAPESALVTEPPPSAVTTPVAGSGSVGVSLPVTAGGAGLPAAV